MSTICEMNGAGPGAAGGRAASHGYIGSLRPAERNSELSRTALTRLDAPKSAWYKKWPGKGAANVVAARRATAFRACHFFMEG